MSLRLRIPTVPRSLGKLHAGGYRAPLLRIQRDLQTREDNNGNGRNRDVGGENMHRTKLNATTEIARNVPLRVRKRVRGREGKLPTLPCVTKHLTFVKREGESRRT